MAFSTESSSDVLNAMTEAAPDELWPEGWSDAELRILATDLD